MKAHQELTEYVDELRKECPEIRKTIFFGRGEDYVEPAAFSKLVAGCRLLVAKLGPHGKVWDAMLADCGDNRHVLFERVSGVLDAIANALAKGRLATVAELVSAEVLGDFLEHAEVLLRANFNLAAAVVLRAVLEERLRALCTSNNCSPTAPRPTIENFKQALYAKEVIDKIATKDIEWMASVGNAAAHRLQEYKDEDVPPFYQRLTAFLLRFSVT
jgi:hypothetical protein